MQKQIFVLVFVILAFTQFKATAQPYGFNVFEIGGLVDKQGGYLSLQNTLGITGRSFSFGIGGGYDRFKDWNIIPYYIDLRYNIIGNETKQITNKYGQVSEIVVGGFERRPSIYLFVSGGRSLVMFNNQKVDQYDKTGLFLNTGIGFLIGDNSPAWNFSISYKIHQITETNVQTYSFQYVCARIGVFLWTRQKPQ